MGVGLWASHLQVRNRMQFPRSKAFYHGLEKCHQYCFTHDISVTTDHNPLVAFFKKGAANLSHKLQKYYCWYTNITSKYYTKWGFSYSSQIGYLDTTMKQGRDKEVPSMHIIINAIIMHSHTRLHDSERHKSSNQERWTPQCIGRACTHPQRLRYRKEEQPHWLFRDEIAFIDRNAVKGRRIIIPTSVQDKALKWHINHMDIEKASMLGHE